MTCVVDNNSFVRHLYFQCQQTILTRFNISSNKISTINELTYLIISVDSNYYTRTTTEKSNFVDTYSVPFIYPKLVRVGFQCRVVDTYWNVRQCLEFLATSSIATSYGSTFIPNTILDYVRPEINDGAFTVRKGLLTVSGGNGTSGSDSQQNPIYTNEYDIEFVESNRRLSL